MNKLKRGWNNDDSDDSYDNREFQHDREASEQSDDDNHSRNL